MSNGTCRLALALLLAALGFPAVVHAQEPAASLADLQQWVRIGDRVTVTDSSGRELTGNIARLKPDSIGLAASGAVRDFADTDVARISRRDPDSLRNGALAGLGIGAGLFLVAVATTGGCEYESDCAALVALGTAVYGGMGAAIGVGIDALIPGRERVIYRHPAGRASIGLSPRLAPQRQAVLISVAF